MDIKKIKTKEEREKELELIIDKVMDNKLIKFLIKRAMKERKD